MADVLRLMAQVHPRARHEDVRLVDDLLQIWVMAPPVEGAANVAVIALLARRLNIPRSAITIMRGASGRHKQIAIAGLSIAEVASQLATP